MTSPRETKKGEIVVQSGEPGEWWLRQTEIPSPGGGLIQLTYDFCMVFIIFLFYSRPSLSTDLFGHFVDGASSPNDDAWSIAGVYHGSMYL